MTFQRHTALKIIQLIRRLSPRIKVVAGGYDPSLAPEAYPASGDAAVDFIVRSEGEFTFSELLRALERGAGFENIAGLTFREGNRHRHNPARSAQALNTSE